MIEVVNIQSKELSRVYFDSRGEVSKVEKFDLSVIKDESQVLSFFSQTLRVVRWYDQTPRGSHFFQPDYLKAPIFRFRSHYQTSAILFENSFMESLIN